MKNINMRIAKKILKILLLVLAVLLVICAINYFINTHFLYGTIIENIPCSFLSLEKAIETINLEKGEEIVRFCFANGKTYDISARSLGISVDETQILRIFNQQHSNIKEAREYNLDGFFLVDTELLKEFLKQIPELQEKNMIEPQDAYMIWDEKTFSIQKEVLGNVIIFDEAINYALKKIKNDEKTIDFSSITHETPDVLEKDLIKERDELNSILNSTINFELSNNSIVTLDSNIIKDWVYQDENSKFKIDIENGVHQFVEDLAILVNDANSIMYFNATDCEGVASVNVPWDVRPQLDKEKEIAEIKTLLGNSEPIHIKPIYDRILISDMLISYIEIDLSRQHIWFYLNGTLLLDTPCVTGCVNDGNGTPTGVFFLLNKNRGVYLKGYNNDGSKYSSYVEYWMRFNQGIGMHDATWRWQFGGQIYLTSGSHGCVNMPKDAAAKTYEYIDQTMPIIVYQSKV